MRIPLNPVPQFGYGPAMMANMNALNQQGIQTQYMPQMQQAQIASMYMSPIAQVLGNPLVTGNMSAAQVQSLTNALLHNAQGFGGMNLIGNSSPNQINNPTSPQTTTSSPVNPNQNNNPITTPIVTPDASTMTAHQKANWAGTGSAPVAQAAQQQIAELRQLQGQRGYINSLLSNPTLVNQLAAKYGIPSEGINQLQLANQVLQRLYPHLGVPQFKPTWSWFPPHQVSAGEQFNNWLDAQIQNQPALQQNLQAATTGTVPVVTNTNALNTTQRVPTQINTQPSSQVNSGNNTLKQNTTILKNGNKLSWDIPNDQFNIVRSWNLPDSQQQALNDGERIKVGNAYVQYKGGQIVVTRNKK